MVHRGPIGQFKSWIRKKLRFLGHPKLLDISSAKYSSWQEMHAGLFRKACSNSVYWLWFCWTYRCKCVFRCPLMMKQLEVVVSPPAFVWDPNLTLNRVTFDLDPCALWPWPIGPMIKAPSYNTLLRYEFFFWSDFWSSDTQTDAKRNIWAHRAYAQVGSKIHKSVIDNIANGFRWPCVLEVCDMHALQQSPGCNTITCYIFLHGFMASRLKLSKTRQILFVCPPAFLLVSSHNINAGLRLLTYQFSQNC